jgi:hypothetical protein
MFNIAHCDYILPRNWQFGVTLEPWDSLTGYPKWWHSALRSEACDRFLVVDHRKLTAAHAGFRGGLRVLRGLSHAQISTAKKQSLNCWRTSGLQAGLGIHSFRSTCWTPSIERPRKRWPSRWNFSTLSVAKNLRRACARRSSSRSFTCGRSARKRLATALAVDSAESTMVT